MIQKLQTLPSEGFKHSSTHATCMPAKNPLNTISNKCKSLRKNKPRALTRDHTTKMAVDMAQSREVVTDAKP
jgi:hypothetical protein